MENSIILALVGMPGAGKSEAVKYLQDKNLPFIRFGDATEKEVKSLGLPLTPENEKMAREKIRQEKGMNAFAVLAKDAIQESLSKNPVLVIDGLYSWEEYTYLKNIYSGLKLIHVYAEPEIRYQRLSKRSIRPIQNKEEAHKRDIAEIENLNKGGPIAIADFLIKNSNDDLSNLYQQLDDILGKLKIENI